MRGLIFRAFQDHVAEQFGDGLVDELLAHEALTSSGGAYTTVGDYPTSEFVTLAVETSARTNTPLDELIFGFGKALFAPLAGAHADMVGQFATCFDLLASIETVIHRNVRKLYDTTEVPSFDITQRDGEAMLVMHYKSARPFADLAAGLIAGALAHYGETAHVDVARTDLKEDKTEALFKLTRHDRAPAS